MYMHSIYEINGARHYFLNNIDNIHKIINIQLRIDLFQSPQSF